jgi:Type I restriction enzyme R protein N terminus (HSDR_N)
MASAARASAARLTAYQGSISGGVDMATRRQGIHRKRLTDFLVVDPEERQILLVEVKARRHDPEHTLSQMSKYLSAASIPFGMLVDADRIEVYRWKENHLSGPVYSTVTASILRYYTDYFDKFKSAGLDEEYLLTLVKAWLRDLAYRWKSKASDPPGARQLVELGLLPLLKDARIDPEVPYGGNRLHRN